MPGPADGLASEAGGGGAGETSVGQHDLRGHWAVFAVTIVAAGAGDILVVSRGGDAKLAARPCCRTYVRQIQYWLAVACLFNLFVWRSLGSAEAGSWLYGYFLEYLLSVDNLFVFRLVFKAYSTPLLHQDTGLFWGVTIAIVLRVVFFGVGTEIMSLGFLARCMFGVALIYSGVKTLRSGDDDEDDPRDNPLVRCIASVLPVHDDYTEDGSCCLRPQGRQAIVENATPEPATIGRRSDEVDGTGTPSKLKGAAGIKVTLLFLVIVTLGIIDVVFAVDSVTVKISALASFSFGLSFFLNLTSSALAMFMLRSLYTLMDSMTRMFRFLSSGVGVVLLLIGVKLILGGLNVEIGMLQSTLIIVAVLLASVVASAVMPEQPEEERDLELPAPAPKADAAQQDATSPAAARR